MSIEQAKEPNHFLLLYEFLNRVTQQKHISEISTSKLFNTLQTADSGTQQGTNKKTKTQLVSLCMKCDNVFNRTVLFDFKCQKKQSEILKNSTGLREAGTTMLSN